LKKNKEKAYTFLRKAIEIDKKNKKEAIKDADFESIREDEEFKKLTFR